MIILQTPLKFLYFPFILNSLNSKSLFHKTDIHAKITGTYFNCIMFMVASSVVTTIMILNYHHRQSDMHHMPDWVRGLTFQYHVHGQPPRRREKSIYNDKLFSEAFSGQNPVRFSGSESINQEPRRLIK